MKKWLGVALALTLALTLSSQTFAQRSQAKMPEKKETVRDANDLDYQSFYKVIPEDEFPAASQFLIDKRKKVHGFQFEEIDYPYGDEHPQTYRFDMGPAGTPVQNGYTQITKDDLFTWEKGYGWSVDTPKDDFAYRNRTDFSEQKNLDYGTAQIRPLYGIFERHGKELISPWAGAMNWHFHQDTYAFYDAFLNDMSRDAVLSPDELAFKVTLPDGRYMVSVVLGDLQIPRYAMEIYANGVLIDSNKYTGMVQHRGFSEPATPWLARVSFPIEIVRNNLRIAVRANDNLYWERMEVAAEPPGYTYSQLGMNPTKSKKDRKSLTFWGKHIAMHGPATQMAIAGLTITPYQKPPLELIRQHLFVDEDVTDKNALEGAKKYNDEDIEGAAESFAGIPDSETFLKASAFMALAGSFEVDLDKEPGYIATALEVLDKGLKANPGDIFLEELRRAVWFYSEGLYRMVHASERPLNQVRVEAIGLFQWVSKHNILYSKALSHIGRCYGQTDPHRWVTSWYLAEEAFLELEEREPGNRVSGYYLYGDLEGWDYIDYSGDTEGAPKWAVTMREAYNRLIDQAEWWGDNRQLPDGRLGGGWGDDVEIGICWEAVSLVNPDASEKMKGVVRAIAEGVWWSGDIDRDAGFFDGLADVEHTGEWTGDSQPFMIGVDYGNPIYFERCLQTGVLMRDLWTGINDNGHRHFKSMMLGNVEIGKNGHNYTNDAEVDHPLNGRAASPAYWCWWYSNGDQIDKIFSELATAWREDCERTDNGKPEWAIPGAIGYHTDVLGGNKETKWRDGAPKGNAYKNPTYTSYVTAMCKRMYLKTLDPAWLKPKALKLTSKGIEEGIFTEMENPLEPKIVEDKYETLNEGLGMETIVHLMRSKWPSITSEVASTDRIAPTGILQALTLLTGGNFLGGLDFMPCTYLELDRNVAFMTVGSSNTSLKIVKYNFNEEDESYYIRPWCLQVGGEYKITVGIDNNDDDIADETISESEFTLVHRGDRVPVTIPARKPVVIEFTQTKSGKGMPERCVDLAIAPDDIQYKDGKLSVTVHNIGNLKSKPFACDVWQGDAKKGKKIATLKFGALEAPNDMLPKRATKSIDWRLPENATIENPVTIAVQLDPQDEQFEITEFNNTKSQIFPPEQKAYMVPRMWPLIAKEYGLKRGDHFPPEYPKDKIR